MSWRFQTGNDIVDNDIVIPDDINAEWQGMIGEMNGHLDRDNLTRGMIAVSRLKQNAAGVVDETRTSASVAFNIKYGVTPFDGQSSPARPNMVMTKFTLDAALILRFSLTCRLDVTSTAQLFGGPGILCDGRLVAVGQMGYFVTSQAPHFQQVEARVLVSAGSHRIMPCFLATFVGSSFSGAKAVLEAQSRRLYFEEARR